MATTNLMRLIGFLFLAHFATAIPFLGHNELGVAVSSDNQHLPVNAVLSPRKTVNRRGYFRALSVSDKSYIGHLSSNSETGFFGLTTSNASALVIQYDASSPAAAPYNLNITNGQGAVTSFPNLGLTFGANPSPILNSGSSNFCLLTAMDPTPKGSPPIMVRDSSPRSFPGESAIFTVDGSDNIVLKWINPDGSSPATFLIYSLEQNRLTATGDVAAYKEAFGQDRIEVVYQFVEIH